MKFTVVTPSFKQHDWLRLCIASVADQAGVDFEHIVQDGGCSTEAQSALEDWGHSFPRLRLHVEKDGGMYDAVNRGLRRGTGEICSYLNCDEQYLPGALASVAAHFAAHPELDILFGDAIVVLEDGQYLCDRKALTPHRNHTLVSHNLSFLTCALFFRRRVLERDALYFDPKFRASGDADWALRALEKRLRMAVLPKFVSTFAETGDNLCCHPQALQEIREMFRTAPAWARLFRTFVVAHFWLRRFLRGGYTQAPYDYSIYTQSSLAQRKTFHVSRPTGRWIRPGLAPTV